MKALAARSVIRGRSSKEASRTKMVILSLEDFSRWNKLE
jgi:hypothetical protein